MEVETRGCAIFLMDLARQQGLDDVGTISKNVIIQMLQKLYYLKSYIGSISDEDKLLLRIMMPVAKMFTAKKAVANASEGIECFGGQVKLKLIL